MLVASLRTTALVCLLSCVSLVMGLGCTKAERKPATKLQSRGDESAEKRAPVLKKPQAEPRPLPACLAEIDGLTEPQRSAAADELTRAHASLFEAKGPRSAEQLEQACAYTVKIFELALRQAVHEHRDLVKSQRKDRAAWVELERRWKALASRGSQTVDTCRETVPGSAKIGEAVQLALQAQAGADRLALAEASMRRLLRYYPERVEAVAGCLPEAKLAALREATKPAEPNPLTAEPWPTKVEACDRERKAHLCTLRGRLPRDEAEAMALLDEPPKHMVDPKDCRRRYEEARAKLGNTSWCYEPPPSEPAQ